MNDLRAKATVAAALANAALSAIDPMQHAGERFQRDETIEGSPVAKLLDALTYYAEPKNWRMNEHAIYSVLETMPDGQGPAWKVAACAIAEYKRLHQFAGRHATAISSATEIAEGRLDGQANGDITDAQVDASCAAVYGDFMQRWPASVVAQVRNQTRKALEAASLARTPQTAIRNDAELNACKFLLRKVRAKGFRFADLTLSECGVVNLAWGEDGTPKLMLAPTTGPSA